jgi:hypothetical protein
MDHLAAIDIVSAFGSTIFLTTSSSRRASVSPVAELVEASCRGPPAAAATPRDETVPPSHRCGGTVACSALFGMRADNDAHANVGRFGVLGAQPARFFSRMTTGIRRSVSMRYSSNPGLSRANSAQTVASSAASARRARTV